MLDGGMCHIRRFFNTFPLVMLFSLIVICSPLSIETPSHYISASDYKQITIRTPIAYADDGDGMNINNPFGPVFTWGIGWMGLQFQFHIENVIGWIMYGLFLVASYFMIASGILFDVMLNFGLNPEVMKQPFVQTAWTGIRDLVNMLFIFVLIYIAIATILDINKHHAKQTITKLIIAALLINFSLFVSRAIIDAGNISALFFYDAIEIKDVENLAGDAQAALAMQNLVLTNGQIKGVSLAIMSTIHPQQILINYQGKYTENNKNPTGNDAWKLVFLYLASTILVGFIAITFLQTAFLFLSRIAILWILMAFSPFMFAGTILPETKSYASKLWKELIGKSFCITIFLFFLWLTVLFANPAAGGTSLFAKDTSSTNFLQFIVLLTLKFGVIIILLNYGKELTKKRCESFDGKSFDFAGKLLGGLGAVAGLAVGGGAAMAGRAIIGRTTAGALNTVGKSGMTTRQSLASGNMLQRGALRVLEKTESSSFDARNTRLGKTAGNILGTNQKGISMIGSAGQRKPDEGFTADVKKKEDYFKSIGKKLGDPNDKDPAKAAAAKAALERFEKKMDKPAMSRAEEQLLIQSPYYRMLKRASKGKDILTKPPEVIEETTQTLPDGTTVTKKVFKPAEQMSKEESKEKAKELLTEFRKETLSESRKTIGQTYDGTLTQIGKTRAAEDARKSLEKAAKLDEKRAVTKDQRDKDEKQYNDLKGRYDAYHANDYRPGRESDPSKPADYDVFVGVFNEPTSTTPSGYSEAVERSVKEIEKKTDRLTTNLKMLREENTRHNSQLGQLKIEQLKATGSEIKESFAKEYTRVQKERDATNTKINETSKTLSAIKERTDEMKQLIKLSETMNRYAKDDLNDMNKPSPSEKKDDIKK